MADKTGNTYTIAKTAAWHVKNKCREVFDDAFINAWLDDLIEKGMTEKQARQKIGMLAIEKITDWMMDIPLTRKQYTYRGTPEQQENFRKMREALEKKQAEKRKLKAKEEKQKKENTNTVNML